MSWEIKIKRVCNGYILEWEEQETDTLILKQSEIIEDGNCDKATMTRLLEYISEYFGNFNDKYGSENLEIKWNKKGYKVE